MPETPGLLAGVVQPVAPCFATLSQLASAITICSDETIAQQRINLAPYVIGRCRRNLGGVVHPIRQW